MTHLLAADRDFKKDYTDSSEIYGLFQKSL